MDFNIHKYVALIWDILRTPKLLFVIFLCCLALLIMPESVLEYFGLFQVVSQYRYILAIIGLLIFIILLIELVTFAYDFLKRRWVRREDFNKLINRINSLSHGESDILYECISSNSQSFTRPVNSTSAQALCQKKLVEMSDIGHVMRMSYTIKDSVWIYLKDNKNKIFCQDK